MGIYWNPRHDGTNRPRRLRGNSSARLVGSSVARHRMELIPSGNGPPEKYVFIYTITGKHNSQTHIHSHGLTYIFWEWPSR
ncbi:hypothetical protein DPMN_081485 [Dreissena polymorpha]|uniref:Uncharacterized protein n=1 Tax=Dreissena polymorpha TaxID=45954 RepID=A0A9D3Y862_DREPO|nr:hypothetical protein DPMN_081485 [Dreissena polymorpha]